MRLHLISFDIPYPPDYGGAVDVYNKIRVLNNLGCKVILHAFYKSTPDSESTVHLNKICSEIYLYKRELSLLNIFSSLPYIVKSRAADQLMTNLIKDNSPILFEGLHSCRFLSNAALKDRKKIVRMHNIEWKYYEALAQAEKNFFKRQFFKSESVKLLNYETIVSYADHVVSISKKDDEYLRRIIPATKISHLPPFHFTDEYKYKSSRGNYVLFQGDLSISDTENVLMKMIPSVFKRINIPVIIAGKNPRKKLIAGVSSSNNVKIIPNPDGTEMYNLIKNAHIILVYSGIKAGMKLKLINGLFQSRFIIGDENSISDTGAEKICHIENNYEILIDTIRDYWKKDFSEEMNHERNVHLDENFSNIKNGKQLQQFIK